MRKLFFSFLTILLLTGAAYAVELPASDMLPEGLAEAVEKGEVDAGIALCGTGNGMAMTLNHHPGIRAGLAWNTAIGHLVKEHNNANVLVMPARFISYRMAVSIVREWLTTDFAGGRHQRRIEKIPLPR